MENKEYIKILGTYIHNTLTFNFNFIGSKNSLYIQLQRRANTLIHINKYLNDKMFKNIANAILIGKINYHLILWPLINKKNKKSK